MPIKKISKKILFLLMIFPVFWLIAASAPLAKANSKVEFKPQITIPNSAFKANDSIPVKNSDIGNYISAIYDYGILVIGVFAVVVMMAGGIMLIASGGSQERVQSAKGWISASVTGLVLALTSYSILYFINPELTKITSLGVVDIEEMEKKLDSDYVAMGSSACQWSQANTCAERWLEKDRSYCSGSQPKDSVCCCPPYGGDWEYDYPAIEYEYANDASDQLKTLITCLRKNLPEGVGRISSISDSYGLTNCQGDNYDPAKCHHSKNSCHYGGGIHQLSHAVDIGDEENAKLIKQAYDKCEKYAGGYLGPGDKGHDDHIHISTKDCRNY